jgi:hypothetical protein
MTDVTTGFAETNKLYLDIHHVNSGKSVVFKAFLQNYSEQFNTAYDEQYFVMNQQPVRKLKSTVRSISLSWVMPAADFGEAHINMGKISLLSNMLYPEQVKSGGGFYAKVGGSPIFKLRLVNFMVGASHSKVHTYSAATESGLLGYIDGFNYSFMFDEGFFLNSGQTLPKNIEASFTYHPVNEKSPAWINKEFNYKGYPYKEGIQAHGEKISGQIPVKGLVAEQAGAPHDPNDPISKNAAAKLTEGQPR